MPTIINPATVHYSTSVASHTSATETQVFMILKSSKSVINSPALFQKCADQVARLFESLFIDNNA
jgi:hypothetical protein